MQGRYLMMVLLMAMLMVSCTASRKMAASASSEMELSTDEQRRYEYYYLEAVRLEQQNRYDEAFEMIQHCLDISPSAPSALYKASTYYFFLNSKSKAVEALTKAIEGEPDNYWYRQALASYYQENGEYDKAIAVLEEMQQLFPKHNGELLSALVGLYGHTQKYDKVVEALTHLEGLIGKTEAISIEKSRNYLLMGDKQGAFDEMEALAAEYSENSYYRVVLASVYMEHERVSDALQLLNDVLAEEPDNGAAKITLSHCYKIMADTVRYHAMVDSVLMSTAVDDETKVRMMMQLIMDKTDSVSMMKLCDRVMQQPQKSAKLGHLCVQYLLNANQPEERIRPILLKMIEAEPDHVQARLQLLAYAARRNNMEEVVEICSAALDYTPEILDFYYYMGIALYQTGHPDEAMNTYRKALAQVGDDSNAELVSDIFAAMGDLSHEMGVTEDLYLYYDSALVYNPQNIVVLNNYAYYLSEEDRELEKAEQMSLRTIKVEPKNATYLDTYAWVLYKQKRYDEALDYIEQALAADSAPSAVLYEHAGDICFGLNDIEQAVAYWEKALDMQRKAGEVDEKLKRKVKQKKI